MKSVQLYRLLSEHAGVVNRIALRLYKGEIETEDAMADAYVEIKRVSDIMEKEIVEHSQKGQ